MLKTKIPGVSSKIVIALQEDTHSESYYLDKVLIIPFTLLVYSYKYDCYSGSGFAVWKNGNKWGYLEMGHCSCNGPWDFIDTAKLPSFTFKEVEKVANKHYDKHANEVIAYIKKNV